MIVSPLKGKYFASSAAPFAQIGPDLIEFQANIGITSRLTVLETSEDYNGIPEEIESDIVLDPSLSYIAIIEPGGTSEHIPLTTLNLSDQGVRATAEFNLSAYWDGGSNTFDPPENAEVWVFLNPTKTWPTFWNENLRPQAGGTYAGYENYPA
jgi:hypothetical protein